MKNTLFCQFTHIYNIYSDIWLYAIHWHVYLYKSTLTVINHLNTQYSQMRLGIASVGFTRFYIVYHFQIYIQTQCNEIVKRTGDSHHDLCRDTDGFFMGRLRHILQLEKNYMYQLCSGMEMIEYNRLPKIPCVPNGFWFKDFFQKMVILGFWPHPMILAVFHTRNSK